MRYPTHLAITALVAALATLAPERISAAEAFELGDANFAERPGGKEADAIVGDFVLRNDQIAAVISGNLPLRRANMGAFYGDGGETPGCLYDLTLLGADNDQITIFSPTAQRGPVNYVRIIEENGGAKGGAAVIETFVSAAKAGGISRRHQYRLEDGWRGVLIVSTLRNEGNKAAKVKLTDAWTQMRSKGSVRGINWADAIDPADKCGYAFAWVAEGGAEIPGNTEVTLKPGESVTVARFLAVANSPAEVVGVVAERRGDKIGSLVVTLKDAAGKPVTSGRVVVDLGGKKALVPAYPDKDGIARSPLPEGATLLSVEDMGRDWIEDKVEAVAGAAVEKSYTLSPASAVAFTVTDEAGVSIPCKVQFLAVDGTPRVNLGPTDRAHGCVDQYHSESGAFRVALPPGSYEIVVTRGPEYSHHRQRVTLVPGKTQAIKTTLKRQVKTPGWISTDYHNHSTPSGDNVCGTDDRVINLAAEHIEFAATTEHNRLYDWRPHIERLGLAPFLNTVPGMELTGRGAHFNTFPMRPDPKRQDGGAPVWKKDPRLNAITLRDWRGAEPDRWVQVNHPDMVENFIDRDGDGRADGGYAFFGGLIDALETQNYRAGKILAGAPYQIVPARKGGGLSVSPVREFIWLQLLNQGLTTWGVAVSDAHHVYGNGVGGWRTYVRSGTDDPAKADWRELSRHSKAGRMILSTGPYLEVETGAGIIAGGHDRTSGKLDLKVRVQCADWLDIDRVQVLVNGRQAPEYNYTRKNNPKMFADGVVKFDHTLELDLSEDAHLIVVAVGEGHTLATAFGTSGQAALQPMAYNNPIFVDVDGGGFQPNGDTLGYGLPVGGVKVEDVKAILEKGNAGKEK